MVLRMRALAAAIAVSAALPATAVGQTTPPRGPEEGKGPFTKLVIRGVNVIDGAGRDGPRAVRHRHPGQPDHRDSLGRHAGCADAAQPPAARRRPRGRRDRHVGDAGARRRARARRSRAARRSTYAYKLWLAHGVTTVRGVSLTGNAAAVRDKAASERNEIVAPRIYQLPAARQRRGPTARSTRRRRAASGCNWASVNGIDGVKFAGTGVDQDKAILAAMIDEAKQAGPRHDDAPLAAGLSGGQRGRDRRGWGSGPSRTSTGTSSRSSRAAARTRIPDDYNYADEQSRWRHVAKVIDYTFEPGSPQWWAYLTSRRPTASRSARR